MIAKLWATEAASGALDRLVDHVSPATPPALAGLAAQVRADVRVNRLAGGPSELLRDLIADAVGI
jgi:hypothetical protein